MIIPIDDLPKITLNNIIEEYVLRQGGDHNDTTYSLAYKSEQILSKLMSNKLVLTYSQLHDSVTIQEPLINWNY